MAGLLALADVSAQLSLSPTVAIVREGAVVKVGYTGTLQSAAAVTGPWLDVTNAANPFVQDSSGAEHYFRARAAGPESIFATTNMVAFTVKGPLQAYFEKAFAGMPDGIFPPVREKPWFDGFLTVNGQQTPADLRVRGNSSLQECPFPKLKFKVSSADRAGTPFFDAREVKVGTHCAEGGRGPIGRLRDQIAAFREALAYEAMNALGFISPRVRRALIEYNDTTPAREGDEPGTTGWQVIRHALIFDDVEVIAERLGARALDGQEIADLSKAGFDELLIVKLRLLHVLLGNWDFTLSIDGGELWNTDVIQFPDGRYWPIAGDFDLSSWVTERVQLNAPWDYHPELADIDREARFQTEKIQTGADPSIFAAARDHYLARRTTLEALVAGAQLDDAGRTNAQRHIQAFYAALEPIKR